jgi:hypothetical protein
MKLQAVAESNNKPVNEQSKGRYFIGINLSKKADQRPASEPQNKTILEIDFRVGSARIALDADKAPNFHTKDAHSFTSGQRQICQFIDANRRP